MKEIKESNSLSLEIPEEEYQVELNKIRNRIEEAEIKIYKHAYREANLAYYDIGTYINERSEWGHKYIPKLVNDLKDKRGFSRSNLFYMCKFAKEFEKEEIVQQDAGQIPWFSLITIMEKCKSKQERLWYMQKTFEYTWSRKNLILQIKAKAFERNSIEPIISKGVKEYSNPFIKNIIKDSFYFSFVKNINDEKELKNQIVSNFIEFLQESGKGNAFVGKEYKIRTKYNKNYYVDLLMYNVLLHAYVVVEVKIGEYKPEYYGQLKNYVVLIDDNLKSDIDNKTLGILLVHDADNYIVRTTFENEETPLILTKIISFEELEDYLKKNK